MSGGILFSRLLEGIICGIIQESWLKTTVLLAFFQWLVKLLKNLNDRPVDHLEKCGLLSDFWYCFRFSRSAVLMLSVILLSTLIMQFSILSVIRHLICGNSQSWLLNLHLLRETIHWSRSGLLISMMEKLGLFCLKMDGSLFASGGNIIF